MPHPLFVRRLQDFQKHEILIETEEEIDKDAGNSGMASNYTGLYMGYIFPTLAPPPMANTTFYRFTGDACN